MPDTAATTCASSSKLSHSAVRFEELKASVSDCDYELIDIDLLSCTVAESWRELSLRVLRAGVREPTLPLATRHNETSLLKSCRSGMDQASSGHDRGKSFLCHESHSSGTEQHLTWTRKGGGGASGHTELRRRALPGLLAQPSAKG
ncbi:hypothetical protein HPB47_015316 [Ixodes persulcatus]|uniref:Uncharacterized protein n=1 Tax=Ixodes persulcatus TaxID=34615 RepID=A0AC60QTS5_IXOPE|nr:hypothetical protein HPB47_015316 [Ixodes persulcatus]